MLRSLGGRNHQETQQQHWRDFHKELSDIKDKKHGLSVSYDEIAQGLGISRQRLSQFVQKPEVGLPIDRASILELWDYLTAPDKLADKDISQTAIRKRGKLREEKPDLLDVLLKAAGFLPTSRTLDSVPPQIERIKRRLNSFWIPNSHMLSHITDNIIDTILDQGGIAKSRKDELATGYSADAARKWHETNIPRFDDSTVQGFKREITRFANSGKMEFCDEELFELYQSILENNSFKDFNLSIRVVDCQFTTKSFSLVDEFEDAKIKNEVSKLSFQCERNLRSIHQPFEEFNPSEEELLKFPPVIEAAININFRNREESNNLTFSYASSTTHVANMLVALFNGMGYISSVLNMTGFSIRAIGQSRESLARVSIMLTDKSDKTYHGLWVEQSTITGILQAVSFAVMTWLSERLDNDGLKLFYTICYELSEINAVLYKCIHDVYNHSYNYGKNQNESIENELKAKVIKVSEDLAKKIECLSKSSTIESPEAKKITQTYFENCKASLDKKSFLAQLALTHAALVKSKSSEAEEYLKKIKDNLYLYVGNIQIGNSEDFTSILILFQSELMFSKLLCGDRNFINDREWRNSFVGPTLKDVFENLQKYVANRNSGVIDTDVYLAVSQFSGIVGIVELYTCQKQDTEHLNKATETLISSACYSARIGQKHRACRAICHAIRICCRLGNQEKTEQLSKGVRKILDEDLQKHPASIAQYELCKGEELLRFGSGKIDFYMALNHFLKSWHDSEDQKFQQNPFLRTKIDSLYDIYRVFIKLKCEGFHGVFLESIKKDFCKDIRGDIKRFENFIAFYQLSESATFSEIEKVLKEATKTGWNSWCTGGGSHPFSERIENDSFLEDCT